MTNPIFAPIPDYLRIPILQMPATAQNVTLVLFGLTCLGTFCVAVYLSQRSASIKPLLYFVGAMVTAVVDPLFAHLGRAVHAQVGQIVAFEAFGLDIPVHAVFAYGSYFAPAYLFLIPQFKAKSLSKRNIHGLFCGFAIAACVFETPFILLGLWRYLGTQPLQLFPAHGLQPLWWSVASSIMVISSAAILARLDAIIIRSRRWLLIPLAPMTVFGSAAAVCWPAWLVINSRASMPLQYAGAITTIGLSVILLWLVTLLVAKDSSPLVMPEPWAAASS